MKGQFLICSYSELKTFNLFFSSTCIDNIQNLSLYQPPKYSKYTKYSKYSKHFEIHLCNSHLMLEALDGFIIVLGTDGHILYTRYLSILLCWESLRLVTWPSSFMSINFGLGAYIHDTTLFSSLLQKNLKSKIPVWKDFSVPIELYWA